MIAASNLKPSPGSVGRRPPWHGLVAFFLVVLFFPAILWLPWQAQRMEANERQEQLIADTLWVEQTIRFQMSRDEESLQLVANEIGSGQLQPDKFRQRLSPLMRSGRELMRVDWFDANHKPVNSTDDLLLARGALPPDSLPPAPSVPGPGRPAYRLLEADPAGGQQALLQYLTPLQVNGKHAGYLISSYSPNAMLEEMVPWWFAQDNEILLADGDDLVLARRFAGGIGKSVYTHQRQLDLPGLELSLRTNSIKSAPTLLPNLLVGSVIILAVGLLWSLWALWRDINRRIAAELALRQQVSFRTAMENSLLTGLRARDLEGRVTYVNPAFSQMVGIPGEQLIGMAPPMPYWAPEAMKEYQQRLSMVLSGRVVSQHETIFLRANGERFPVLIYESPLVDDSGKQTGWMGSILDISDRRRAEDLNRQQQEKLQASARLATMGEMASTLAHELNQPLAAISSYATGALNLLNQDAHVTDPAPLRAALEKASAQAQRAGQIIRSVHAFVKKREPLRDKIHIADVIESVTPLINLQARPFFVVLQIQIEADLPPVLADRVLLEQVLLNLTRNGIEAMRDSPPDRRVLRIVAARDQQAPHANLHIEVIDHGHGIAQEVAERLFSPFFSTKAEGMGMGLNICRTAIEFHGGELSFKKNPDGGTTFHFCLPAIAEH